MPDFTVFLQQNKGNRAVTVNYGNVIHEYATTQEYDGLIYTSYVGGNPIIYCLSIDYISLSLAYKSTEIACVSKYLLKSIDRLKFV